MKILFTLLLAVAAFAASPNFYTFRQTGKLKQMLAPYTPIPAGFDLLQVWVSAEPQGTADAYRVRVTIDSGGALPPTQTIGESRFVNSVRSAFIEPNPSGQDALAVFLLRDSDIVVSVAVDRLTVANGESQFIGARGPGPNGWLDSLIIRLPDCSAPVVKRENGEEYRRLPNGGLTASCITEKGGAK